VEKWMRAGTRHSIRPDGISIKPDAKTMTTLPLPAFKRYRLLIQTDTTNMPTLVFATHNPHKVLEIAQILGPDFIIKTLDDIGQTEEIPETAETLAGNALLKAHFVMDKYGLDCFSEDTGLEVEALAGAPGVHTARYAGESRDPEANIQLLLKNLAGKQNRRARFRTVICLLYQGHEILLEGVCSGSIAEQKQGTGGFGYDPVFIPYGYEQSFAELGMEVKNELSHRAKAAQQLVEKLQSMG